MFKEKKIKRNADLQLLQLNQLTWAHDRCFCQQLDIE